MSQAKVDRYKEEKKNRSKNLKKKKIRKYVAIFTTALCLGALCGVPIGKRVYKYSKAKYLANKTVAAVDYQAWFKNYWVDKYYKITGGTLASSTDATTTDASATDAAQ